MFGGWGNNNANNATNNPAQGTSGGFGTANAFGQPAQNTGAFGAFGQPQPNQTQPTTGFGAAPANNAFGAFGGGTTAFGAKPATGFGSTGAFGAATQPAAGTSSFGGGGFGAATGSTGAFGQPAANTNTAGTNAFGGGAFGSTAAANSAWGKPAIAGFGQQAQVAPAAPQGTANPPYAETTERDSSATNVMLHYHSISCMPAYINYSPEELRAQDYAVGRKNAASNVPAAPQTSGFGAATTGPTGFGAAPATGAFGQPAQPATGGFGAFGTTNTNTTGGGIFGQTNTAGGFGTTPTATNPFGQTAATPANPFAPAAPAAGGFGSGFGASTATTGGFGAANNAAKPFGFGASPATNTTGAFGAFGQPAANAVANTTGTNAFGQPAANNAFGAFGAAANKPTGFGTGTGAFGQTNPTTNAFGQQNTTTNAFGQQTQQATNAFGQPVNNPGTGGAFGAFGQQPAQQNSNPFGQPAQQTQNPNPFGGGFGQPAAQQATNTTGGFGIFGAKPATPTLNTGAFGGFGQQAGQQQQQQQNNQLSSTQGGGGLFGQSNGNTGGGLFGQPKPGGLLGTGANPFSGGFGQSNLGGFGGMVNANPAAASTNANPFGAFSSFGQPAANTNNASTSTNLFTQSSLQPQQQQQFQQPSLTASVDQPFNSGVPVFELLPGASSSGGFSSSAFGKKKQSNFFMKRKPLPATKSIASLTASTTGVNPLRGFASSSSTALGGSVTSTRPGPSGISLMLKGGTTPAAPTSFGSNFMAGSLSEKKGLNSEVFSNSPGRQSVKKLVLDKDPSTEELSSALSRNAGRKNPGNALELFRASSASAQHAPLRAVVPKSTTDFSKATIETEKLEKGVYWISPNEAVLGATPFKDLEAVLGFKCGRIGYGQVEFLDPVNLTLVGAVKEIPGKFIIFDEKECTVYPEENDKPPVGQGLNVRAKITLDGCWATDRATREPIKSEDHPKHAAHMKKLRNMPNTTFDSFDIEKGTWSFIVEHFSRYGLGAEDDEDEDEMVAVAEIAATAPVVPAAVDHSMEKASTDDDDDDSMEDDGPRKTSLRPRDVSMRRSKEPTTGHRRKSSSNRRRDEMAIDENDADNDEDDPELDDMPDRIPSSWPAQLGMDPQRLGQMQHSLFAVQNAGNSLTTRQRSGGIGKAIIKPPGRSATPSALGKHPRELGLMEEDTVENGMQGRAASVERPSFAISRAGPEVQDLQIVPARKFVKIAKDSLARGKENLYRDAGLAFGRSFRVGWGPGGVLVHLGQLCGPRDEVPPPDSFTMVNITEISTTTLDDDEEIPKSEELLRVYILHTEVTRDSNNIPQITRKPSLDFQPFAALFPPENTSFEASLWRLASALFDEIPLDVPSDINPQKLDWIANLRRKMKVGDWLQTAVAPAVEQVMLDSGAAPHSKVFALLTGNQIERACDVAMDAGDFHLATLITQIGGDRKFRDNMWSQWMRWIRSGTDVFLDEGYRRLYCLLAGEASYGSASASADPLLRVDKVHLTDGLNWKQAFALHFWYAIPIEEPLSTIVEVFDETRVTEKSASNPGKVFKKDVINPPPWYAVVKSEEDEEAWGDFGDPLLHLLRLFQDNSYSLADALAPQCFSPHKLDYRLSWLLYWTLVTSLGLGDATAQIAELGDRLTVGYAMQLENQSLHDAAVFVLLHLRDPLCRAAAIQAILMRHPPELNSGTETNLESFEVPKRWRRAAQGALARYLGKPHEAYRLYIAAQEEKFACDIVIADLVTDAILRFDRAAVKALFEAFSPDKIDDWSVRGKLFLDYVQVIEIIPGLVMDISHQEGLQPTPQQSAKIDRIFSMVSTLLRLLPAIMCPPQETGFDAVVGSSPQDKRRKAALDEMKSELVHSAESLQSILARKQRLDLRGVEPGARLIAVQNAAYNQFYASIGD